MIDAEPQLLHNAGPEIFQHKIGCLGELENDVASRGLLEIDCDAALVAIDRDIVGAFALEMRRRVADHIAEAARLDLDDVGAHVAQQHAAERTGEKIAQAQEPEFQTMDASRHSLSLGMLRVVQVVVDDVCRSRRRSVFW